MRAVRLGLMAVVPMVFASGALAQRVDIFTALQEGSILAEFRGNGDSSVTAVIERLPGGPTEIVIPAGSRFRVAQFGDLGQGYGGQQGGRRPRFEQFGQRGGGRQGMMGSRSTIARLEFTPTVRLTLTALCTDFNKPAPTFNDRMAILPPANDALTRLAQLIDAERPAHPAAQLATWAVADNIPRVGAERYLLGIIPGSGVALAHQRQEMLRLAADLVSAAGLQPMDYQMFRR